VSEGPSANAQAEKASRRLTRRPTTLRTRGPPKGVSSDAPVSVFPANPVKSAPAKLELPGARPPKG
jgi:hypothetical protein